MKQLHITVKDKVAEYTNRDGVIVCGNSDYQVVFAFDSSWDGLDKTARFVWGGKFYDVPIGADNTCIAPVLYGTTECSVGVYSPEKQTTTSARIPCQKSILCESDVPAPEYEEPWAVEAQKSAEAAAESASSAAESAMAANQSEVNSITNEQLAAQHAAAAWESAEDAKKAADSIGPTVDEISERLDGKLDKMTNTSSKMRLYAVNTEGEQVAVFAGVSKNEIVTRADKGNIILPPKSSAGAMEDSRYAAPLWYVDDGLEGKLDKDTSTSDYVRAYIVKADGSQGTTEVSENTKANSIVKRKGSDIYLPAEIGNNERFAVHRKYVDDKIAEAVGGSTSKTYKYAAIVNINDTYFGTVYLETSTEELLDMLSYYLPPDGAVCHLMDNSGNHYCKIKYYEDPELHQEHFLLTPLVYGADVYTSAMGSQIQAYTLLN